MFKVTQRRALEGCSFSLFLRRCLSCDLRGTYCKGKTCKAIALFLSLFWKGTKSSDLNWSWFLGSTVDSTGGWCNGH